LTILRVNATYGFPETAVPSLVVPQGTSGSLVGVKGFASPPYFKVTLTIQALAFDGTGKFAGYSTQDLDFGGNDVSFPDKPVSYTAHVTSP